MAFKSKRYHSQEYQLFRLHRFVLYSAFYWFYPLLSLLFREPNFFKGRLKLVCIALLLLTLVNFLLLVVDLLGYAFGFKFLFDDLFIVVLVFHELLMLALYYSIHQRLSAIDNEKRRSRKLSPTA